MPDIVSVEKFPSAFARHFAVYRAVKIGVPVAWLALSLSMLSNNLIFYGFGVIVAAFIYLWTSGFIVGRKMLKTLADAGGLSADTITMRLESTEKMPWKLALIPTISTAVIGLITAKSLLWIGFSLLLLLACIGAILFSKRKLLSWVKQALGAPVI